MYVKKKMSVCSHYGFRGLLASRKCFQRFLDPDALLLGTAAHPPWLTTPGTIKIAECDADGGIGEGIPQ